MTEQDVRFATRAGIEMEGQRAYRVRRRVEDVIFICDDCHVTIDVMLGEPEENRSW